MTIISWADLAWCLVPVVLVCLIYVAWHGKPSEILIATARMSVQLIGVGYVLVAIFENPSPWISLAIVSLMLVVAGWIAIRPVRHHPGFLAPALVALAGSVGLHLLISVNLVLDAESWFQPRLLIPLAGMYFANTMNAISLAAERYHAELHNGQPEPKARITAFQAAMIPQVNSLLAVGLVALPGMMTGQILAGVSPLTAVRYQVMIMSMVLGASGVGTAIMLWLLGRNGVPKMSSDDAG
ncbi:ABC transporter permease [Marinobacterium arenosum]|uniref:ABC transporter permease n=1 Tax=Marinobacterium arenosum TaxID=2862496 RepID=UPI001C981FF8|nr:ABC transporter permease [Marinobacterium arenosum]MBY4679104.1 ABC transporter permease [Marinobacterium arenosum]